MTICATRLSREIELVIISATDGRVKIFHSPQTDILVHWRIGFRDLKEPQITPGDIYLEKITLQSDVSFLDDSGGEEERLHLKFGQNIGFFLPRAIWRAIRLTLCEDMNSLAPHERI